RIARLLAGGRGWLRFGRFAAGAGVRWIAGHRENRNHRDKAEDSPAKPAQGSDPPSQHASPVLIPLERSRPSTTPLLAFVGDRLRTGQRRQISEHPWPL